MKGDFSRFTFDRTRHAHGVLIQQGRLQLDADDSEAQAVQSYRMETGTVDVVGPAGVPKLDDGFRITLAAPDAVTISQGRMYVDGLLAENESDVAVTAQPSLPGFALPTGAGLYVAFLDVGLRELTALDDPSIREVALGGPDTAIRETVVWQVKFLRVGNHDATVTCESVAATALRRGPRGTVRARARAGSGSAGADACGIAPDAAFRGIENQLYRVEIHEGGPHAAATVKWSRDNASLAAAWLADDVGANKIKIGGVGRDGMPGFEPGDWVELLDSTNELYDDTVSPARDAFDPAGRPGVLLKIDNVDGPVLTFATQPPSRQGDQRPKVRGWNSGAIRLTATNTEGFVELEDGIEVEFDENATYTAGDHWLIPARTITADIVWPGGENPAAREPDGVHHHHAPLALLTTVDGQTWTLLDDCRPTFPSLTEICAEDVCFDNAVCEIPGAETVQDAIEALCTRSDLRKHNRNLHGWGVVCGLQVRCDAAAGSVRVAPGYAIDPEGNDLDLTAERTFDVLAAAQTANLMDANGDGDVDLVFTAAGQPFVVGKHEPRPDTLGSLLEGTIIRDFVDGCVRPLQRFFEEQFSDPDGTEKPVGPVQTRVSTLNNLLIQVANPDTGKAVYLSATEDKILRRLHADIQKLLGSRTFCAMWEGARPFPTYPFDANSPDTIFTKGFHDRMRKHPRGRLAYTVGRDHRINVVDLRAQEVIAVLDHPGGPASRVTDVAFSRSGNRLYATALHGADTLFAVADINGSTHTWRPHTIICDVQLLAMATETVADNIVHAIGLNKGLYLINPDNVDPRPTPKIAFAATGQWSVLAGFDTAFAVVRDGTAFSVASLALGGGGEQQLQIVPLPGVNRVHDILAVSDGDPLSRDRVQLLFVATNNPTRVGSAVHHVRLDNGRFGNVVRLASVAITDRDTPLALGHMGTTSCLLVTVADENRLAIHPVGNFLKGSADPVGSQPVQVTPAAVVTDSDAGRAWVLNQGSNTLTAFPDTLLRPGTDLDVLALAAYRSAVLNAMADLLGGILQYLKDCFCEKLLVSCPTPDGKERIHLACVHIRAGRVRQICNFTKRKYVKSFPTMGYWLSGLPIAPLIGRAVEVACCAVLPDRFGKLDATAVTRTNDLMSSDVLKNALGLFDQAATVREDVMRQLDGLGPLLAGFLGVKSASRPESRVDKSDVVGRPVGEARATMEARGVIVERSVTIDHGRGLTNLFRAATAPVNLPPGTRVTLVEEDGVVRYYATTGPTEQADLVELQRSLGDTQRTVIQREADLRDVRSEIREVVRRQAEIAAVATPERLDRIDVLHRELEASRADLAARDQEIATLRESVRALRVEVANGPARLSGIETELRQINEFRERVDEFIRITPRRIDPPDG